MASRLRGLRGQDAWRSHPSVTIKPWEVMPGFQNAVIIFSAYLGYNYYKDWQKTPSRAELDEKALGLVYQTDVGSMPELVAGVEAFKFGKASHDDHGHGH